MASRALPRRRAMAGPVDDTTETPEDYRARFAVGAGRDIELICANPDRVVWKSVVLPGGDTSTLHLASAANVIDAADWTCVAFDNRGHRVTAGADCATAAGTPRIAIGFNDQEPLYVDLL